MLELVERPALKARQLDQLAKRGYLGAPTPNEYDPGIAHALDVMITGNDVVARPDTYSKMGSISAGAKVVDMAVGTYGKSHRLWHMAPAGPINVGAVTQVGADYIFTPMRSLDNVAEEEPCGPLDALLKLADGWNGEGSLAPSAQCKNLLNEVYGALPHYVETADVDVDPTTGEVTFSWFFDGPASSVTVAVLPSVRIVVIRSEIGHSDHVVLNPGQVGRLARAAHDAGLHRLDA